MDRKKASYTEGAVAIFGNVALFVLKYWAGIVSGSIALLADAWHTLSDSISSVVVILGAKLAAKKPDKDHPFGHGRWELVSSIVIAMLLVLVFFIFVQFVANSRALVRMLVEKNQTEMEEILERELGSDRQYLTIVQDGNLQRLRFSDAILFDTGSDELKTEGERVLQAVGRALGEAHVLFEEILIEGHTDEPGSKEYNIALGERRAGAVKSFFLRQGIDSSRLIAVSYGKERPIDSGKTQTARAKNRRVHIVTGD